MPIKIAAFADASKASGVTRRRRAALLSSAAMAASLLLLQPRAAYAVNENCTTAGDTVTCEGNTDGINLETRNLVVDNDGPPSTSIVPPAGTIGIRVINPGPTLEGDITVDANLPGATLITRNADGVVIRNFFPEGAVTLDFAGDIVVTGSQGVGGNNPGQFLYGAFISTGGDSAGDVDASFEGGVRVTTDYNSSEDGDAATLGANGIAVYSGGGVTLTATGDVVSTTGTAISTVGAAASGSASGIFADAENGPVSIDAAGVIAESGAVDGQGSATNGSASGASASAPELLSFVSGDVTATSGNAQSIGGSAQSGTAVGVDLYSELDIDARIGVVTASSGSASSVAGGASSGGATGVDVYSEGGTATVAAAGDVSASTGSVQAAGSATSGEVYGVSVETNRDDVSLTVADVIAASGTVTSTGDIAGSGSATGIFSYADRSNNETSTGNVTATTGNATGATAATTGETLGVYVYAYEDEEGTGNLSLSAGDVVAVSGDALVTGSGNAYSGDADGVELEADIAIVADLAGVRAESGSATTTTGIASSGDADGVTSDAETVSITRSGSIAAITGDATSQSGNSTTGDATGADADADGAVSVALGAVSAVSGNASSQSSGVAASGSAMAIDIETDSGSIVASAGDVSATSGDATSTELNARSGDAVGIDMGGDAASLSLTTTSVTAVSGDAAGAADVLSELGDLYSTQSGDATGIEAFAEGAIGATIGAVTAISGSAVSEGEILSGDASGVRLETNQGAIVLSSTGAVRAESGFATGNTALSGDAVGLYLDSQLGSAAVAASGDITVLTGAAVGALDARSGNYASGIDASSETGTTVESSGDILVQSGTATVIGDDELDPDGPDDSDAESGSVEGIGAFAESGLTRVDNRGSITAISGDVMHTVPEGAKYADAESGSATAIDAASDLGNVLVENDGTLVALSGDVTPTGSAKYEAEVEVGDATGIEASAYSGTVRVINTGDIDVTAGSVSGGFASSKYDVGTATGIAAETYGGGNIDVENSGDIVATAGQLPGLTYGEEGPVPTVYSGLVRGISAVASAYNFEGVVAAGGDVEIVTTGDVTVNGGASDNPSGAFDPGLPANGPFAKYTGISAGIFATSEASLDYAESAGSIEIVVDGASVTANGDTVHGIFASSAQSTVILANGASVTANGAGANGIIVGPQFFDSSAAFGVASSQNLVVVGEGTSVISEQGIGILDVEAFSVSLPVVLRVVDEAEPQGPLLVASAPNDTTVRIAGTVRGGPADGSGTAVSLQGGDDTVVIEPGYEVTGLVDGGTNSEIDGETAAENDSFALGGTGTDSFDISTVDADGTPDENDQYVNFETFRKQDESTFYLTGDNGEIEAFPVRGGRLFVQGNVGNAAFPVSSGATLGGTGTVGALTAMGGSTIAPGVPGNSAGTLSVNGDATFEEDSNFEVTIAADNSNDLLAVGGTTTIQGGTIRVVPASGALPDGRDYTIITSDGGVDGEFDEVVDGFNLPDIELTDFYFPESVVLGFRVREGDGPFSEKANALAAVFGAGNAAMNFSETLSRRAGLTESGSGTSFVPLGYDDTDRRTRISQTGGLYGADLAIADIAPAPAPVMAPAASLGGLAIWVGGLAEHTDVDADGSARGYESESAGLAAGLEYRLIDGASQTVYGVAGGYTRSDISVVDGGADVDGGHIGLYAGYTSQAVRLTGALSYSFFDYDLDRQVVGFTGDGSADGDAISGHAQAFYNLNAAQTPASGLEYGPIARVRGVYAERDGFDESGLGILNLSVEGDDISQFYGAIGGRVATTYAVGSMILSPELEVFYERNFSDSTQDGFATLTALGGSFPVAVTNGGEDLFAVGAGVGAQFTDTLSGHVRYDGSFGDGTESHRGSLGLSLKF